MRLLLVVLAVLVSVAHAQVAADLIKSLPNFSGKLGVQYSGYLPINNNKQLHYWFVQSQNDPAKDPVVLWLNGGPGCSSMDGLFYENGPVSFTGDDSNTTLVPNPSTWASIANMLYLEAPAGVGFSYAPGQLVYSTDDTTTAADNYEALKQFFTRFPSFKNNEFFISGESYAGVYIPMLAKLVVDGASSFPINLKGTLTGNGVTDDTADSMTNAFAPFVGGHGLVSPQVFDKWIASCSNGQSGDPCDDLNSIFSNAINGLDPYDIYSDCFHQRSSGGPPCVDSTKATTYLNRPDVKAAIHVKSDLSWTICSNIDYNSNADSMVPIYKYLLQHKIRVLIYSGDSDSVVPWTGSQYWTSQMMGFKPKAGRDFTQWYFNDENGSQVGGYVTEYAEGLQFITILASGHMVPQFKPKPALSFFSKFISNTPI